jgi:hypothetical protein
MREVNVNVMRFMRLRLGSHLIMHGYDADNREITQEVKADGYADYVVALASIRSVSEKHVLIEHADGRWIYWEYEGGMQNLMLRMEAAGVLIN